MVKLPAGSRVDDAIRAAGGLTAKASLGELNLAAPVNDGDQVIIGPYQGASSQLRRATAGPEGPSASVGNQSTSAATGTLLDLNSATAEQLEQLPGVGPVTAKAILAWRTEHGRFTNVTELQEVDGIGPKTYAQLAPHVRV